MRYYHKPRIFSLTGSVGACGSNNSEDVAKIQENIIEAGYSRNTGRSIKRDGKCSADTIEAIRWYQRLLNISVTGLVNPTDIWFVEAMENASSSRRNHSSNGVLSVKEGQLTFDYEGIDYITAVDPFRQPTRMPCFSRILHHPSIGSGVTIGRGYDMKKRSAGEILFTLRLAGIEEYKSQICAKASFLSGKKAASFIELYGPLVGEITHQQQIRLFELSYKEKKDYAKNVYNRSVANIKNALSWEQIELRIRDVFVDTIYQGNNTANEMSIIIAKGQSRSDIIDYLRNDIYQKKDAQRLALRLRYLQ
ncbi:peptidoglycan-binding protein [Cronobacter malonaticus]|uniref:peptidoglycan-binding protein n=1 Tax=Cronobacter malonaticus TaxID=413503 RepID=UPI000CFDB588|nr:peptidoglycan-binding protein [Cronobacter malonaticus]NCH02189.1 peptidoglycan-binding protein [Cronobacter malonaticus]NCH51896.1 peptidoglycan-binding protein [Cronobacter malonaticus]